MASGYSLKSPWLNQGVGISFKDEEHHYDCLLNSRTTFETHDICNGAPIDGVNLKCSAARMSIDGETKTVFQWTIWKYKLIMDIILPKAYPILPPTVRLLNDDPSNKPLQHPDVDSVTGFLRFEFGDDQPWTPKITLRKITLAVMEILSGMAIPVYTKPTGDDYVRGDYRHRFSVSEQEFQFLVNPFGCKFRDVLRVKYHVRFEPRGGKSRAHDNSRYFLIKSDSKDVFPAVVAELQEYLLEKKPGHREPASVSQNCASGERPAVTETAAAKEDHVLEDMKGVSSIEKPSPSVGRGRGRGRGRGFPIFDFPDRSNEPAPASRLPATSDVPDRPKGRGRGRAFPILDFPKPAAAPIENDPGIIQRKADYEKKKAEFMDNMKLMIDSFMGTLEQRFASIAARLDLMAPRIDRGHHIAYALFQNRQALHQNEQRISEFESVERLKWTCGVCQIRDKRVLFRVCHHSFCEPCAERMRQNGRCQCGQAGETQLIYF